MATGWAVASATLLALSLAHVFLDMETPGAYPDGAARVAIIGLHVLVYGAWAYGIAMAAHGMKGALAALFVYAAAWGLGWSGLTLALGPSTPVGLLVHGANIVVGAVGAFTIWRELKTRRGRTQWSDAVLLCLPLVAQFVLFAALR